MENVKFELILQGMEVHVLESLYNHIDSIKKDCEIAVKEAIKSFDFNGIIEEATHKYLKDLTEDAIQNSLLSHGDIIKGKIQSLLLDGMNDALKKEED